MTVEGSAVDQTDDDACGQLTQEEIVLHGAQVVLGDRKGLDDDSLERILNCPSLQGFGVS